MDYKKTLESIGFEIRGTCATAEQIAHVERTARISLPGDYCEFLKQVGSASSYGASIPVLEPSPCGNEHSVCELIPIRKVFDLLSSMIVPRNMIMIAEGHLNSLTVMAVAGIDYGCVYALDADFRCFWEDDFFEERFPHMATDIREYLTLRAIGTMQPKPVGYESLYKIASSFGEFVAALKANRDEDDAVE